MTIHCRNCDEEITFDDHHISDSGKKIPLDVDTEEPHSCDGYSRSIYCNLCEAEITFDDEHISERTGKKIPLDIETGETHDCPVWKAQNRKYRQCRKCAATIYFDSSYKSKNNIFIPLDKDTGVPHQCADEGSGAGGF
jgi:hypothetical protein